MLGQSVTLGTPPHDRVDMASNSDWSENGVWLPHSSIEGFLQRLKTISTDRSEHGGFGPILVMERTVRGVNGDREECAGERGN